MLTMTNVIKRAHQLLVIVTVSLSSIATASAQVTTATNGVKIVATDGNAVDITNPTGMTGDVIITLPSTTGTLVSSTGTPANGDVMMYSSGTPNWQAPTVVSGSIT